MQQLKLIIYEILTVYTHAHIYVCVYRHLISVDGEAFFQGELEPIPHGHSVSTPVVEVLMADYSQDALEVLVCRYVGRSG